MALKPEASVVDGYFDDQVFLLSSFKEDNPDYMFHGYSFVGADYVYGQEGALRWELENNAAIPPGDDGCFVIARKRGKSITFSADAAGNKKIFYYHRSGIWAVSNSLYVLVKHLQVNKVHVHPNTTQLLSAGYGRGPYSFLNQLVSFETPFRGVRLVPFGWELSIGAHGADLRRLSEPAKVGTYEEGLTLFLELWVRRMKTLISCNDATVACDLTGGQDSRAVFALLHRAKAELGRCDAHLKISCGISPGGSTADIDIARRICEQNEFELNGKVPRSPRIFSAAESYRSWKELCLGAYWPVYFPTSRPWPWRIALGGGGGENYRSFYTSAGLERYLSRVSSELGSAWHVNALRQELDASFSLISEIAPSDSKVLIEHYRHFRNRFHSGRTSQYGVLFSPLMSTWLDSACRAHGGSTRIEEEIVNYDLIYNSVRHLLDFDFDSPTKAFDERRRGLVTALDVPAAGPAGKMFVDEREPTKKHLPGGNTALELFVSEYEEVRRSEVVRSLWGSKFLDITSSTLEQALDNKRLKHAIDGQAAAAVIASSLF